MPVFLGAVQETRSESVVRDSGTTATSLMAAGTFDTSKTSESPYMGRVTDGNEWVELLTATAVAKLGRPIVTSRDEPSATDLFAKSTASVPSSIAAGEGPVGIQGRIEAVGAGLVLVVGLVVPRPVIEVLIFVGDLGAVKPVAG